ncbi:MAG: PTS sugar transporter subunit IIA [Phycisphaeraceae bacterium]|nr:PTS sugar transporter subunit IIA [Phycisphaeraceae bacterium]
MRLTDILQPDCIKVPLSADQKQAAIYELAQLLAEKCDLGDVEELKRAVWQRESTRTTGIGHGIGIPHGKCAGCRKLCMAIGIAEKPLDFGAIDGKPVDLILLLASPLDQTGPHIQALAQISRMLTDESLRARIKTARDAEQLYKVVEQYETQQASA